jgi:hypothetical protein
MRVALSLILILPDLLQQTTITTLQQSLAALVGNTVLSEIEAQTQAASGPQSTPHPGKAPLPADQEQFISYWTTETGWTSELQLRNNAIAQDLTVTPVLRVVDGSETSLASVTIRPRK